jgi:hypothetical protein
LAWKFCNLWGVKHLEAFGDSLLVVQQVSKVCQCYNGSLNVYVDRCLDIISCFDEFVIRHIPREDNGKAIALAQQASSYAVVKKYFHIRKLMRVNAELQVLDKPVRPVGAPGLTAKTGLTGPETGLTDVSAGNSDSPKEVDKTIKAKAGDWRTPIVAYLKDPGRGAERNIQRSAFKYVLFDDELYR